MKNLLMCLFVLLVFGVVAANAQGAKIGVVNAFYAMENSAEGKARMGVINEFIKIKQSELDAKGKEVQDLQKRIQEGAASMSEDALRDMQSQLQRKRTELKRFQEDTQRGIDIRRDKVLKEMSANIFPLVRQIALEKDLDLVVRSDADSNIVYVHQRVDITNELIRKMDSIYRGQ